MKTKTTDAVILAAGTGRRYDKNIPKQFIKVTNKSSVEITISKLSKIKGLRNIYLVISKKYIKFIKKIPKKIKIIFGGKTRSESVFNSLIYIKNTKSLPDNILIHDSVRPCVNNIDIKFLHSFLENGLDSYELGRANCKWGNRYFFRCILLKVSKLYYNLYFLQVLLFFVF